MTRLAIIGLGRMGRAVEELAPWHGFDVVARIAPSGGSAREVTAATLNGADVAVEFTVAAAVPGHVRACAQAGCPVVVGTTGWDARRAEVESLIADGPGALLAAPNFSLGMAAFMMVVETAAAAMRSAPGFDAHIIETHHAQKQDAPSGTALALARAAAAGLGRDVPITSVRTGSVPGTHEVVFDGQFEQVRLEHVARDRRVFAEGALRAAQWLVGRRGVFTLRDVLTTNKEPGR
ncbi:MAG TPA: dihydrodipicolinate reductase C-terminal domain-containing protein [Gemmatimonadaceae bacterium]|jgi:4-hydroxy-tetrahydrodipicolinate reductase|nr:dihydrodipicolinate reductase C-terminal domain-containing protein [Gemmatimonadaceae bacterium]